MARPSKSRVVQDETTKAKENPEQQEQIRMRDKVGRRTVYTPSTELASSAPEWPQETRRVIVEINALLPKFTDAQGEQLLAWAVFDPAGVRKLLSKGNGSLEELVAGDSTFNAWSLRGLGIIPSSYTFYMGRELDGFVDRATGSFYNRVYLDDSTNPAKHIEALPADFVYQTIRGGNLYLARQQENLCFKVKTPAGGGNLIAVPFVHGIDPEQSKATASAQTAEVPSLTPNPGLVATSGTKTGNNTLCSGVSAKKNGTFTGQAKVRGGLGSNTGGGPMKPTNHYSFYLGASNLPGNVGDETGTDAMGQRLSLSMPTQSKIPGPTGRTPSITTPPLNINTPLCLPTSELESSTPSSQHDQSGRQQMPKNEYLTPPKDTSSPEGSAKDTPMGKIAGSPSRLSGTTTSLFELFEPVGDHSSPPVDEQVRTNSDSLPNEATTAPQQSIPKNQVPAAGSGGVSLPPTIATDLETQLTQERESSSKTMPGILSPHITNISASSNSSNGTSGNASAKVQRARTVQHQSGDMIDTTEPRPDQLQPSTISSVHPANLSRGPLNTTPSHTRRAMPAPRGSVSISTPTQTRRVVKTAKRKSSQGTKDHLPTTGRVPVLASGQGFRNERINESVMEATPTPQHSASLEGLLGGTATRPSSTPGASIQDHSDQLGAQKGPSPFNSATTTIRKLPPQWSGNEKKMDLSIAHVDVKARRGIYGRVYEALLQCVFDRSNATEMTKVAWVASQLVNLALKLHGDGLNLPHERFDWTVPHCEGDRAFLDPRDKVTTVYGRLGTIIQVLDRSQSVCWDMLLREQFWPVFVNAPLSYENRKAFPTLQGQQTQVKQEITTQTLQQSRPLSSVSSLGPRAPESQRPQSRQPHTPSIVAPKPSRKRGAGISSQKSGDSPTLKRARHGPAPQAPMMQSSPVNQKIGYQQYVSPQNSYQHQVYPQNGYLQYGSQPVQHHPGYNSLRGSQGSPITLSSAQDAVLRRQQALALLQRHQDQNQANPHEPASQQQQQYQYLYPDPQLQQNFTAQSGILRSHLPQRMQQQAFQAGMPHMMPDQRLNGASMFQQSYHGLPPQQYVNGSDMAYNQQGQNIGMNAALGIVQGAGSGNFQTNNMPNYSMFPQTVRNDMSMANGGFGDLSSETDQQYMQPQSQADDSNLDLGDNYFYDGAPAV